MNRTKRMNQISPKRRAALAAAGITHPSTTFASPTKPMTRKAAKRSADTGPDQATVDLVLERDGYSCVVCGEGLRGHRGEGWAIHHRVLRSQGVDNRPSNLVAACSPCHVDIHAGPAKAREAGWLLKSTDVPEKFRVAHSQHGWVLLNNVGGWTRTAPDPDPMEASLGAIEEL